MFPVCDVPGGSAAGNCERSGRSRTAGQVTRDAGDDMPRMLILETAASAMIDDGIEVFREELHVAAAIVGSEVRDLCITSGETARFVRLADTFRSTWRLRFQGLTAPTK